VDGPHADKKGRHFFLGQFREDAGQHLAAMAGHVAEDLRPGVGGYTSTTRRSPALWRLSISPRFSIRSTMPVAPASETSIIGQALHRERALRLQGGQHVEVDQAQGVPVPRPEGPFTITRRPGCHLLEQLLLEGPTAGLASAGLESITWRPWGIPHGVEYISAANIPGVARLGAGQVPADARC
jgi:hypothetical protein